MDRSAPGMTAALPLGEQKAFLKSRRRIVSNSIRRDKTALSRLARLILAVVVAASFLIAGFLIHSYRSYAKLVDARMARGYLTTRGGIYASPRTLRPGQKVTRNGLVAALRRAGYVEGGDASQIWNGSFSVTPDTVEIHPQTSNLLGTGTAEDSSSASAVKVTFSNDGRIADLTTGGISSDAFTLAPESLTNDAVSRGGVRQQLTYANIPPLLVHAITSIEDRRFFDHHGVDIFGVARALIRNAGDERAGQGGSTITQQLVKNTYLSPERTLRRKFAEAMIAFTLERRLSKEDIFALYCNEIYLGERGAFAVRGIDQAARVYFGKQVGELTLTEAATIAGMIQSPSRYSPVRNNEASRARRNTVLGTMVRDGFLTLQDAATAAKEPLTVADFDPARESAAPYFIDYVNRVTERETATDNPSAIQPDAHRPIATTLDLDLQQIASEAIKHRLDRLDRIYAGRGLTPQAAFVALDPHTGSVLAMIGGRNYEQSQLNRATDAKRQPGSVFKPFVYAAALQSGMSPLQKFTDAPQEFTYAGNRKYRPSNYGGGFSMQNVTMRTGLIKSLNVITVDVAMQTGLARVANIAGEFGLPRPLAYPALALGTTEATPLQVATAYATFANGGKKIAPHALTTEQARRDGEQVISPETAFVITDMLEAVIEEGTARAARGSVKNTAIAGKTGTSRDGWFVGYTPNLVCAVWVGFDDNRQLGLTGAEAALPIWTEFMKAAVDLRPELGGASFTQPDGVSIVDIDPETEGLAGGQCPSHERVALLTSQAPTAECFRHSIYFDSTGDPGESMIAATAGSEARTSRNRERPLSSELPYVASTRIDTGPDGRKTLVSEMRLARQ